MTQSIKFLGVHHTYNKSIFASYRVGRRQLNFLLHGHSGELFEVGQSAK